MNFYLFKFSIFSEHELPFKCTNMDFILAKPNKHLVESISTTFGVKQFLSGPAQASGHTKLQIISMFIDIDFLGARNKSTMCVNLFPVEQK